MIHLRFRQHGGVAVRKVPLYPLLVLLLTGVGGYLGCDPSSITTPLNPVNNSGGPQVQLTQMIPARTVNTILVASFNLQRLGPSKLKSNWTMDRLVEIIRQFDVIALQEITDQSEQALPQLVQRVNQSGARYSMAVSPRVGRAASGYYEQYAFVFDTDRIAGGQQYCYLVQDQNDYLHREPFVGRFATRTNQPFTFTLVNVHTDPDEVREELNHLARLLNEIRNFEYPEDDVLLLGDLNAKPGQLQGLDQIPGLESLIQLPTNARKNKTLDNILIDRRLTTEMTGRAGTMDLERMFGVSMNEVLQISDHLPVWAEFIVNENASAVPPRTASLDQVNYQYPIR